MADKARDVEGVAPLALPENTDSDPPSPDTQGKPIQSIQSVMQEVKGEMTQRMNILFTDTKSDIKQLELQFHSGMSELVTAIQNIQRALAVKLEPGAQATVIKREDVPDAPDAPPADAEKAPEAPAETPVEVKPEASKEPEPKEEKPQVFAFPQSADNEEKTLLKKTS